jgi:hypothetical protein
MPSRHIPRFFRGQEGVPLEPREHRRRRQNVSLGGGDPNRERETVEPVQERGEGGRLRRGERQIWLDAPGVLQEHRRRRRLHHRCGIRCPQIRQGQPHHRQPVFQAELQRLAARDQHLERRRGGQ